jgi:carboxypeptidase Taq
VRPLIEDDFERGKFGWLLDWLRQNIHTQGRRFNALELVRRVTGEELSPKYLVRYLRERYGALYGRDTSAS